MTLALLVAVPALGLLALGVLTGLGSRRRGAPWPLAVLSGLCFPVTWAVWYVRDQQPFRSRRRRATAAGG